MTEVKDLKQQVRIKVARISTVRFVLAHAVHQSWKIRQLHVPTAFLNGKLESEVYIKPPEGIEQRNKVLRLNKGLYGLRESRRCWNQRFDDYIHNSNKKIYSYSPQIKEMN